MAEINDRVCIIGSGPAGIAAAVYLQKKGYENYEIYERLWKAGGKAYSPKVYVDNEEYVFETAPFMKKGPCEFLEEIRSFAETEKDEEPFEYIFTNPEGHEIYPLDAKKQFSLSKFFTLRKLRKETEKYLQLKNNQFEGTDLSLPFAEFCRVTKLKTFCKYISCDFDATLGAFLNEIPAGYIIPCIDTENKPCVFTEGSQRIFAEANKKLIHPATFNREVIKVERPAPGTIGKIKVTVRGQGKEKTEEFDRLIVAAPLDLYLSYADADEKEKELFSKIRHEKVVTFLAMFKDNGGPQKSAFIPDNLSAERRGHVTAYYLKPGGPADNCPCTVYAAADVSGAINDTVALMTQDMKGFGFEIKERLYEQELRAFPHISPEDYSDGWHEKIDALQGKRNTYYTGEILKAAGLDNTVKASKDLIERFF